MKLLPVVGLCLFVILGSCRQATMTPADPDTYTHEQWLYLEAESLSQSMTRREKASQVLMTGIDGNTAFPPHLWGHFNGVVPGAILLFGYNIADTPEKVHAYVTSCTEAFEQMGGIVPPFFAIDHEGGVVFRLSGITSPLPSAQRIAQGMTLDRARELYHYAGLQLRCLGISLNLGPVAEPRTDANAPFLASRSFGSNHHTVTVYSRAAVNGYLMSGVIPAAKHYPGNSAADPHTGLSVLDVSLEELESGYLQSFTELISDGLPAVLLSHVIVPAIDPVHSFCLSKTAVTGYLRDRQNFKGLILTDDLSMGALAKGTTAPVGNAVQAIRAGCDMIMTSDTNIAAIVSALVTETEQDPEFNKRLHEAVTTILYVKLKNGLVKTARQKYWNSRYGNPVANRHNPFNAAKFENAREQSLILLEELNARH